MIQKHKTRKFHKTRYIAMGTYVGKTYCSLIKTVLVFFSLTCKFVSSQEIRKYTKLYILLRNDVIAFSNDESPCNFV